MRNKVSQSRRGERGNCFQACLASILGTELYDIPDFVNVPGSNWFNDAAEWLYDNVGVHIVCYAGRIDCPAYAIASYKQPNGRYHTVVIKDWEIIHDPMGAPRVTFNDIDVPTTEWYYLWFVDPLKYVEFINDVTEEA
jgi:hypothetical protein